MLLVFCHSLNCIKKNQLGYYDHILSLFGNSQEKTWLFPKVFFFSSENYIYINLENTESTKIFYIFGNITDYIHMFSGDKIPFKIINNTNLVPSNIFLFVKEIYIQHIIR